MKVSGEKRNTRRKEEMNKVQEKFKDISPVKKKEHRFGVNSKGFCI